MSDYIFNCFKEHVTTGLVCSLSVDATDVLTEWRGQAPLCHCMVFCSLPGVHTLTRCILYTLTLTMAD